MTKIEWVRNSDGTAGRTWNPIVGCSIVSPGCTHCYAMRMAARIERMGTAPHYAGTTKTVNGKPVWTGKVALAPEHILTLPLRTKKPTTWFVNSMSDLFHPDVPDEWIDPVFAAMGMSDRHAYQVLTKRPDRMRQYFDDRRDGDPWAEAADEVAKMIGLEDCPYVVEPWQLPLDNVWLGTSVERQKEADERMPHLVETLAAVRFVSAEPLLGPIDLTPWLDRIDWVICGGESGPGARPMHPDWARSLRDQCVAAGVKFFFKQHGAWAPFYDRDVDDPDWRTVPREEHGRVARINLAGGQGFHGDRVVYLRNVGKKAAGRMLDGRTWDEMPEVRP